MISVVVCTYNRADALEKCLHAFRQIKFEHPWELIVVDNNSSDSTASLLKEFHKAHSQFPLKVITEHKQGLGNARNAGFQAAKYNVIAYTDDDCYPQSDYLTQIKETFDSSTIGFCGGRVLLHNPDDLKITIQLSEQERHFPPKSFIRAGEIHGANFCFRKEVLQKAGGFDPLFGAGASFPCEDIDTLSECLRLGYAGIYNPDIVVSHDHGRKTQAEYDKLMHSYDIGRGAFYIKRILFKSGQRFMYAKYWFYFLRRQNLSKSCTEIKSALNFLIKKIRAK